MNGVPVSDATAPGFARRGGLILPWKGQLPVIHPSVFVAPNATVIGRTRIGPDSSIWFGVVVRGDVEEIQIGARTNIQDNSVVHVSAGFSGTYIGDEVLIGHSAVIHACRIESGAFVGMKALILDGVHIESGAMVAAGAVVTPGKRVPKGELWAGSPAKKMRDLTEADLAGMARGCRGYVEYAAEYRRNL